MTNVRLLRGDRTARIQFDVDLWLAGLHVPGVATWHGDADLSEASFTRLDLWPAVEELLGSFDSVRDGGSRTIVDLIAFTARAMLRFAGEGAEARVVVPAPRARARRAARVARAVAAGIAEGHALA